MDDIDEVDKAERIKKEEEKKAKKARYKKRLPLRKSIKEDLLLQLQNNNVIEITFTDLISDYLSLWDIKNELIYDIETKGVSLYYQNGANQWGYKKNDCIPELNRVNGQMLKILSDLEIKPGTIKNDDDFDL